MRRRSFKRLSAESRYYRFMRYKKKIDDAALEHGVHPRPGQDFVFVATIPAADGIDIVGAGQYVRAGEGNDKTCEFAVTVAEDWRGIGLATWLLANLVRHARRDGYETMEGWLIAQNTPMLAVERKLRFKIEPVSGDATVLRIGARCSAYGGNNSMVTHAAWTSYFAGNGNRSIISERDRVAARVRHWRRSRTTPAFASASVGHCTGSSGPTVTRRPS